MRLLQFLFFFFLELHKPILQLLSRSKDLLESDSLIFLCNSQSNQSNLIYQWYHDNKALSNEHNSILTNHNSSLSGSGKYWCSVDNTFQKFHSQEIQINVMSKYLQSNKINLIDTKFPQCIMVAHRGCYSMISPRGIQFYYMWKMLLWNIKTWVNDHLSNDISPVYHQNVLQGK